jgi:hypothetical protein
MKTKLHYLFIALALLALSTLNPQLSTAFAQGTAFTYQGQLSNSSGPASGTYDLTFKLWNASSAGGQVGGTLTNSSTVISNGLFTVILDFGGVFNGSRDWLELGVRTNGAVSFATLSPRQELTPTPYAITAQNVTGVVPASQLTGTLPSIVLSGTSLNASQLTSGTVPDAQLSTNVALLNGTQTFTRTNTFHRTSGPSTLIVTGDVSIDTNLFTGLGFQYSSYGGEGAIMSAFNDGFSYLSFYTKQAMGFPIAKRVIIDPVGGVAIDQQNVNNGTINDATTNGVGLTFGLFSGEGIASKRTAFGNQYGLDFYTSFTNRMSIRQNGFVGINTTNPASQLEVNGDTRIDGHRLLLSSGSDTHYGLAYVPSGLPGISYGEGPFLFGWDGGALGVIPTNVCLSWDYLGNAWVSNNFSTASLTVRNGGNIQVSGAGINTSTAAFIQVATYANTSSYTTTIHNPLCDGDPNAILIATHRYNNPGGGGTYETHPYSVWYDGSHWTIYHDDYTPMATNIAFNVLIIKN